MRSLHEADLRGGRIYAFQEHYPSRHEGTLTYENYINLCVQIVLRIGINTSQLIHKDTVVIWPQ